MKFFKLKCDDKKGGVCINPVYDLPVFPYKILDSKSELILNNKFRVAKGKKLYDVLPFEKHFGNIAISRRIKDFLETNKVTGWSCFPIEIENVTEQYFAFQVLGKSGGILNLDEVNHSYDGSVKRKILGTHIRGYTCWCFNVKIIYCFLRYIF